jgi:hypothetical protein
VVVLYSPLYSDFILHLCSSSLLHSLPSSLFPSLRSPTPRILLLDEGRTPSLSYQRLCGGIEGARKEGRDGKR